MEIELQYLYRSTDAMMVPAELAGFALAESLSFEIVDSFWDTHELALRKAGCSLRIRRQSNLPHPVLTWKGPSEWRDDGARQREEVEVPIDHVPTDAAAIIEALKRYHMWELVGLPVGLDDDAELEKIGELKNKRTSHLYVQGLHRLELAWDRITYPVGEPEARLEVEAKRQRAARFLGDVHAELLKLYGKKLVPAPHGKAKEMCRRLYPDMFRS